MSESDTDRVAVRTYVPAYQKERWREHAEELNMSQSEFVRSMVQAGRRGFGTEDVEVRGDPQQSKSESNSPHNSENGISSSAEHPPNSSTTEEGGSPGSNPGGFGLETHVLDTLREQPTSFEELVSALTDDIEERLDETLQELQSAGRVRYSGREGGYVLVDDD